MCGKNIRGQKIVCVMLLWSRQECTSQLSLNKLSKLSKTIYCCQTNTPDDVAPSSWKLRFTVQWERIVSSSVGKENGKPEPSLAFSIGREVKQRVPCSLRIRSADTFRVTGKSTHFFHSHWQRECHTDSEEKRQSGQKCWEHAHGFTDPVKSQFGNARPQTIRNSKSLLSTWRIVIERDMCARDWVRQLIISECTYAFSKRALIIDLWRMLMYRKWPQNKS